MSNGILPPLPVDGVLGNGMIIGAANRWEQLPLVPQEVLDAFERNLQGALGQGIALGEPVAVEFAMLAGLVREIQMLRQHAIKTAQVVEEARPFVQRAALGAKPHEQDKLDAQHWLSLYGDRLTDDTRDR